MYTGEQRCTCVIPDPMESIVFTMDGVTKQDFICNTCGLPLEPDVAIDQEAIEEYIENCRKLEGKPEDATEYIEVRKPEDITPEMLSLPLKGKVQEIEENDSGAGEYEDEEEGGLMDSHVGMPDLYDSAMNATNLFKMAEIVSDVSKVMHSDAVISAAKKNHSLSDNLADYLIKAMEKERKERIRNSELDPRIKTFGNIRYNKREREQALKSLMDIALSLKDYEWCKQIYQLMKQAD